MNIVWGFTRLQSNDNFEHISANVLWVSGAEVAMKPTQLIPILASAILLMPAVQQNMGQAKHLGIFLGRTCKI